MKYALKPNFYFSIYVYICSKCQFIWCISKYTLVSSIWEETKIFQHQIELMFLLLLIFFFFFAFFFNYLYRLLLNFSCACFCCCCWKIGLSDIFIYSIYNCDFLNFKKNINNNDQKIKWQLIFFYLFVVSLFKIICAILIFLKICHYVHFHISYINIYRTETKTEFQLNLKILNNNENMSQNVNDIV